VGLLFLIMENLKEKWASMSLAERRAETKCFLVDHHLIKVNPCSKDNYFVGYEYLYDDMEYVVFKITENESRGITFIHAKLS